MGILDEYKAYEVMGLTLEEEEKQGLCIIGDYGFRITKLVGALRRLNNNVSKEMIQQYLRLCLKNQSINGVDGILKMYNTLEKKTESMEKVYRKSIQALEYTEEIKGSKLREFSSLFELNNLMMEKKIESWLGWMLDLDTGARIAVRAGKSMKLYVIRDDGSVTEIKNTVSGMEEVCIKTGMNAQYIAYKDGDTIKKEQCYYKELQSIIPDMSEFILFEPKKYSRNIERHTYKQGKI